jgi:hypothetical protein
MKLRAGMQHLLGAACWALHYPLRSYVLYLLCPIQCEHSVQQEVNFAVTVVR